MKFSLSWLRWFLDTDASAETIAATLNRIGLEVEGVDDPAARLAGFRVARVLSAAPHPNADKLQVLSVDAGPDLNNDAPLQVVCGAPNARAGLVGVLGLPGAVVPAGGMTLKTSAIRGVESNGMMCSARELALGEGNDGIVELPAGAPVGTAFADYLGSDPVFDVAITPNRPDCMGVHGIARDLAAAGLGVLKPLALSSPRGGEGDHPEAGGGVDLSGETGAPKERPLHQPPAGPPPQQAGEDMPACPVAIRTDDPEGCPAFYGRVVTGVANGASPEWMQARLRAAGQRPISALVDITNYLMLAFGRPAHVYDLARLNGAVVARRARDGEQVVALNGKTYTLAPSMTVIADDAGVHDIAGIMGGAHSGVSETTTDVLLEIAWFDPARIGATGRALNLTSDARTRFERGVDPGFLDTGLDILTDLIVRICGGSPSVVVRAGAPPATPKVMRYDPALAGTLGGVAASEAEQRRILTSLGFTIAPLPFRGGAGGSRRHGRAAWTIAPLPFRGAAGGGELRDQAELERETPHPNPSPEGEGLWRVSVPTWRPDIDGDADIVEEVVRIHGLDRIASVPLPRADGVAKPTATPAQRLERRVRRAAAARGLDEAVTWSFLPEADAAAFADGNGGLWTLANPISEDMKVMRPSLLPGLLGAARRNLDRGAAGVRLFEIGRRYLRGEGGRSAEPLGLALVLAGDRTPRTWSAGKAARFDAFDAKAEAVALLAQAGAPVDSLQVGGGAGDRFHPGQSATLRLGPKLVLARFGMLHPATARRFDLGGPVAVAELDLDAIPARRDAGGFARPPYAPPPLQAVRRDFAFLVPETLPAGDLLRAVRGADKANIVGARVFDVFTGAGVAPGRVSLAIEVTLQPTGSSYDEAALTAIADRITAAAARLGATLRG